MNAEKSRWTRWMILNAVVAGVIVWQINAATEAPPTALVILQYFLLALSLLSLAGSVVMFLRS